MVLGLACPRILMKGFTFAIVVSVLALDSLAEDALLAEHIADENNLLIVNLKKDHLKFKNELFIYHFEGVSLIPLQPLFDQLDFAIDVDPGQRLAQGWFISESKRFRLQNENVFLNNQAVDNPPNCFFYADDFDYYVSENCINAWFNLGLVLKMQRLELRITSDQRLPFMAKMERDKNKGKLRKSGTRSALPQVEDQYQWLGYPVADIELEYQRTPNNTFMNASMQSSFDLLAFESHLNIAEQQNKTVGSIYFNRSFHHPSDGWALRNKAVTFGDIYGPSDDLINTGGSGVGIKISTIEQGNVGNFTTRTIEGSARPGWDVELYRNGALIEFTTVDNDGRYLFEEVDVEYGQNIFDIKIYGPQGQVRQHRESILIGANRLKPSETQWQLSTFNRNDTLLDETVSAVKQPLIRYNQLSLRRGLTNHIGIGFKLDQKQPEETESIDYQSISLFSSLPGINLSFEFSQDNLSGQASALNIQGNVLDYSTTLQVRNFNEFSSERMSSGTGTLTKLFSAGNFSILNRPVNHTLKYDYTVQTKQESHDVNNQFGFQVAYGLLTIKHRYFKQIKQDSRQTGEINFNTYSGKQFRLRISSGYELKPNTEATNTSAQLVYKHDAVSRYTIEYNLNVKNQDDSTFNVSAAYGFDRFSMNPYVNYRFNDEITLGVSFDISFSPYSSSLSSTKQANTGQVQIIVFLDKNLNGVFDGEDEPLENVKFKGLSAWENLETNPDGKILLTGLSSSFPNKIKIVESTITDPFWRPEQKEFQIMSHAGGFQQLAYAVHETLELEGLIELTSNQKTRPASGVKLLLRDDSGEIVATTVSEFDGVYVFTGIVKGNFSLEVDPQYILSRNLQSMEPIRVNTEDEEGVYYVDDIKIKRVNN